MSVTSLLNKVRKKTGSTTAKDSEFNKVSHWISTGSYALNRIISGDIYKGIPAGQVIIFGGESQSGKSLISAEIASNALNENGYDVIFYFDSEGGGSEKFFESRGCDLTKIEEIPIDTVEDATIKILTVYDALKEEKAKNPDFKALCIVDSLGGLVTDKLMADANKGKQKSDMGLRAKLINNMVKGCTMPAKRADASIIFINWIYSDPSNLFPGKIKNQSGGTGLQYVSSITIQCDSKVEKPEDKEKDDVDTFYKGTNIKFFTTKNRIVKPFYETYVFVDFDKGIQKYDGLLDSAIKYGFILQRDPKAKGDDEDQIIANIKKDLKDKKDKSDKPNPIKVGCYQIPSWKPGVNIKKTDIFKPEYHEAWESFLDEYNQVSMKDLQYSSKNKIDTEQIIENTKGK